VFSRTLDDVSTDKTTLERGLDPDAIRVVKSLATKDVGIGGPTLAAEALTAGLVDRIDLIVVPTIVGGGTKVFPDGSVTALGLVAHRPFANGMMYLGYEVVDRD
jgi:riboflavin biosynthesis pyrimidine reductase